MHTFYIFFALCPAFDDHLIFKTNGHLSLKTEALTNFLIIKHALFAHANLIYLN